MSRLPAGFVEVRHPGLRIVWDTAFDEDVRAAGFSGPQAFEALLAGETGAAGRGRTFERALPRAGVSWVIRPVLHGGWLGGLLGGVLRSPGRAFEELRVTAVLRAAGAPVPRPALAAGRRIGPAWNALVATVREEEARDFLAWMSQDPSSERILRAVGAAGRAVRRFHDAGGRHADLHVKNVLVREHADACQAIVVDLDGARADTPPDAARRMKELARLHRSALKRGLAARIGLEGYRRFLEDYVAGDGALGAALARHWPRERRRVAVHALGYPGTSRQAP